LISQGIHPLWGVKQVRGWENTLFSSKMRQYHLPGGADGCCITSNKSLTCLQLVFMSNWSNFWHAFASHGFVSISWSFLLHSVHKITPNKNHYNYNTPGLFSVRCKLLIKVEVKTKLIRGDLQQEN